MWEEELSSTNVTFKKTFIYETIDLGLQLSHCAHILQHQWYIFAELFLLQHSNAYIYGHHEFDVNTDKKWYHFRI